MSYKGMESPFDDEVGSRQRESVEYCLERLAKERAVLMEAWDQMYSRLGVALGPARPQKEGLAVDPSPERSELCSRITDEAFQLTRISYGIREAMDRLEL